MTLRKIIAPIVLHQGKAVRSLTDSSMMGDGDALYLAENYSGRGADVLLIFDQSDSDEEHEESLTLMRRMSRLSDVPMWGAGNVNRVEDVKKILYAGCRKAVLNYSKDSNRDMLEEVSKRFGREKIAVCVKTAPSVEDLRQIRQYAQELILLSEDFDEAFAAEKSIQGSMPDLSNLKAIKEGLAGLDSIREGKAGMDFIRKSLSGLSGVDAVQKSLSGLSGVDTVQKKLSEYSWLKEDFSIHVISASGSISDEAVRKRLSESVVEGIGGAFSQDEDADLMGLKALLKADGMDVNLFESAFAWEDLKPSEQGLIPVVVQDYRNEEVLMVAYMNREAFEATVRTGVMTYWSRSRGELWVKGLTSGHYQYLKELKVDCDNDTLLARVAQVGAACHTGNRSCFYRTALKKDTPQRNPMKVFEDVYATIEDRRLHPKEGSYTNYLFEKGIDKILKKCGEEAAEIIIAAKNPNPEEVRYEMADFLYHMMVLMSERDITWDDIAQELANRE